MDGDTVVVGASGDDDNGLLSGAVYVFSKPAGGWVPLTGVDRVFTVGHGE